jgi:hypothetical protein
MGFTSTSESRRKKEFLILEHVVPSLYASIKSSKICPECILKHGHIDGFWDLRHAVACPEHRRMAITSCPSCGDTIKWHRRGLLQCKCGQDLSDLRGELITDDAVLDILELIKTKLHGTMKGNQRLIDRGFPLSDLENISFSTLISIVGRFSQRKKKSHRYSIPEGLSDEMHALQDASIALAHWPNGLYDYLENLPVERRNISSLNIQAQFHQFYNSMFKSGLPDNETAFLRKAFVSFGNERWQKDGFIDIRLANRAEEVRHIVGIEGLAAHLNVKTPTIRKYIKKGLITGVSLNNGKRSRGIFDLRDLPFKRSEGKYHKQREAAQFLGMPIKLLRTLRNSGAYKFTRLAWGLDGYSELDLIEFRESLVSKAQKIGHYDNDKLMPLSKISRKKLCGRELATKIIASILDGLIVPVGRTGDEIFDIVVDFSEVNARLG